MGQRFPTFLAEKHIVLEKENHVMVCMGMVSDFAIIFKIFGRVWPRGSTFKLRRGHGVCFEREFKNSVGVGKI